MKLVLSPAKSLDYETKLPIVETSEACFLKEAERLNRLLKKKSARSLKKLQNISDDLAHLNYERNQEWTNPLDPEKSRQAAYAFSGDVYRGLDAYSLPKKKLDKLQDTVRILSGLYGILKPTDLIMPYRLEMGTKLPVGKNKNLHEFWRKKVTQSLNDELEENELFVNLASNEYFKAIDKKALKTPVYNIHFKELKNDKYVVVGFFAKYARGLMTRYIIETDAETLDDLKGFDYEGYGFSEELSKGNDLVFTR
ncbi:MAG: peroxide stress protein YaaA [Bacteroidia bacterium]|nr:peroxide stress protein YaaA [Bacteroidia bacterium]